MFSVFLLALALSVDAFAVAFSYGLVIKKDVASSAAKLGAATGAGQFVMPLLGWLATDSVHRYVEAFDHWIAFVVFLLLGLNVIRGALGGEECEKRSPKLSLKLLSVVAVATSIDACVAGISLYFMNVGIVAAAALIGAVCFCLYRCRILFQPGVLPVADGLPANCRRLCADFTRGKALIRAFVIIEGCFLPGSRL